MARKRYNSDYYLTPEWFHIRNLKLEWSGFKCDRCSSNKNLQVHHKNYWSFGDEMPWDLEVLCGDCHKDEHYIGNPGSETVVGG